MDNSANPVTSTESANSSATNTATTGAPTGTAGEFNASTPVSDMNDLREKAPKVFNAMMLGLATNICNEMKHHQDKLKEMMREAARDASGQY